MIFRILKSIRDAIRVSNIAIRLMVAASARNVFLMFVNLVALGIIPVVIAWVAKVIVDIVAGNSAGNLYLYLCIEAVLAIAFLIALKAQSFFQDTLRQHTSAYLKQRVASHTAKQAVSIFDDPQKQNLLQRAWQEIGFRPLLLLTSLTSVMRDSITAVTFIILISTINPIIAIVLFIASLPALLLSPQSSTVVYDIHLRATLEARRAEYLENLLIKPQASKEIRLFNLGPWFTEQIKSFYDKWLNDYENTLLTKTIRVFSTQSVIVVVEYVVYAVIAVQTLQGNFSIGTFTFLVAALKSLQSSLGQISSQLTSINEQRLFLTELTTYLESNNALEFGSKDLKSQAIDTIVFEDVDFAYPNSKEFVIKNFNLELKAGEATALVGVNGAGKTTLVKLLTRLYDPVAGKIRLNGIDLQDYSLESFRGLFSTVMQDFGRYAFSLKENIVLNQDFQEGSFNNSIKVSQVNDFVEQLPKKVDTSLTRQFDTNGVELSGGQWQRVAIARAIYSNSPILILDEPSSSLDVEAEEELFRAYKDLTKSRISLLITHRFNTVKFADRIVVLEDGKIVEDGSHQELMELNGRYAAMFSKQLDAYKISDDDM